MRFVVHKRLHISAMLRANWSYVDLDLFHDRAVVESPQLVNKRGHGMSEQEIRHRIAARSAAINKRDIDGMIADVDEAVQIYELVPPLQSEGKEASRSRAIEWTGTYAEGPHWHDGEATIAVSGDVAFSHSLNRVTGTTSDGQTVDMWFRTTLGWRRRDGRWRIVHDHNSVPFDPKSGKGRLDLKP